LDKTIEDAIADHQCPGAVVLIGHHGHVVYKKAYGQRSLEPTVERMTTDTIFDMASLTKVVATTPSVMKLFESGAIRLNDPVSKYLPEFAQNGKDDVNIRQLLTHYSGLAPDLDLKTPWSGEETAKQMAFSQTLVTPPGAVFRYSDINFETLGFLVEKISGMPLDEYAQRNVFQPLGMKTTTFRPPEKWRSRIAPTEYDEENHMLRGIVHDPTARRMGGVAGHAGLFSTADDLSKYAQALLDAAPSNVITRKAGSKTRGKAGFLDALTMEKMTTPQQPPNATSLRGLGWDIDSPFSSNRGELFPLGSYGHTGFTGTSMWIDPYTQTYVILLTNAIHPHVGASVVSLRSKVANLVAETLHLGDEMANRRPLLNITGYNEAASGSRRAGTRNGNVLTGLDVLEGSNFQQLTQGPARNGDVRQIALLTNQTGVDGQGRRTIDVLNNVPGIKLAALFSPEHGAIGALDQPTIGDTQDPATGIHIYSIYGDTDEKRRPSPDLLKQFDAVVIDIQDAGVHFYTYESTMEYFLEAAAQSGTEIVVLDRPDPITGSMVQGPIADPDKLNFVANYPLPARHGLTMGELARFYVGEKQLQTKLTVVAMQGWQPGDWYDATSLLWINPSPNLRSLTEATLYPGVALIEGTNVSVGRGTDTPFELVGAPWINARQLADYLNARYISGVRFIPVQFTPLSARYARQQCNGVNIALLDRYNLDSPEMGVELAAALHKLYPNDFQMEKMITILANQSTLDALAAGQDPYRIAAGWQDALDGFQQKRKKYLLYEHR
ncbi:MAG TPA: serine hydrolase, partial [Terriglobales bacterium]